MFSRAAVIASTSLPAGSEDFDKLVLRGAPQPLARLKRVLADDKVHAPPEYERDARGSQREQLLELALDPLNHQPLLLGESVAGVDADDPGRLVLGERAHGIKRIFNKSVVAVLCPKMR